ncbi:MAG: amidohydrolase [Clostridia bacterium]
MDATKILYNGKIVTVDSNDSIVSAIAIRNNKIIDTGEFEKLKKYQTIDTLLIDLKGKTVLPGIVDSHNHTGSAGKLLAGVMLFGAKTIKEMQMRVLESVKTAKPGEWIFGGGWIESQFKEYREPNRWDLDEVSPKNPVVLSRLFGAIVVNSKALEIAEIDKDTPDPWRGRIARNKNGIPTGVLYNEAGNLVRDIIPSAQAGITVESAQKDIKRALDEYQKYGITTIIDPGVSTLRRYAYQDLLDKKELNIRINMMPIYNGLYAAKGKDLTPMVKNMGIVNGFGNEWLNLGALKMAIDGGLGSKSALMYEPYLDGSTSDIPLRLDIDKLPDYFKIAQEYHWSIGIHCCGEKAQDIAVETFDQVISKNYNPKARHNIIHGYFPSEKSLELMNKNNIAVSAQPGFIYVEGDIYFDVIPKEKVYQFKPLNTYQKNGILVAINSDMTSAHYNPFLVLYSAITRKTSQGRSLGNDEVVTRLDAIRMYTINGAKLAFMDEKVGSLEPNKLADMIVLDKDILTISDEEIKEIKVLCNITDGNVVFNNL